MKTYSFPANKSTIVEPVDRESWLAIKEHFTSRLHAGVLVLRFLYIFHICWFVCVPALITCTVILYIMYIITMQLYFS